MYTGIWQASMESTFSYALRLPDRATCGEITFAVTFLVEPRGRAKDRLI